MQRLIIHVLFHAKDIVTVWLQVLFAAILRIEKGLDSVNRTIIESHLIVNAFIIPKHLTV